MIRRDKILFLLLTSIIAAVIDSRENRIPNEIVIIIGIAGIIFQLWNSDIFHTLQCIGICIIAGIAMYQLYIVGAMGAGDVKLYSLLPLYSFRRHILQLYLLVFCVGAVLGLVKLFFTSDGRSRINHFVDVLKSCISSQCNVTREVLPSQKSRIPMAIPFAIGITFAIVLEVTNIFIFFEV